MAGYRGLSDLEPVVGLDPADRLRLRALSEGKIDPKMLSGNGETQLKI